MEESDSKEYDKSTGFMNILREFNGITYINGTTSVTEAIMSSKKSSEGGFLPGFELTLVFAAFSLMLIPVTLRSRNRFRASNKLFSITNFVVSS